MKRLSHPVFWLPLALAVLTAGGSLVLYQEPFLQLSERDRCSYGVRPRWQTAFDALSASAGAGLLTYSLDADYTARGRWLLTGFGVVGAALYLVAVQRTLSRRGPSAAPLLPTARRILLAFAVWLALATLTGVAVERIRGELAPQDAAFNAVAAFASLGWVRGAPSDRHDGLYAAIAFVGALGWPVWLLRWQRVIRLRRLACAVAGYSLFLVVGAGLIAALEVPRGGPRGERGGGDRLADQPPTVRVARALTQVTAAAGAGMPLEPLGDRAVGEGTKLLLAGGVFFGGLGGSAGGALKWLVLLLVLRAGRRASGSGTDNRVGVLHAIALAGLFLALILMVALGLLLIEAHVGSPYQSPPTLADALLDASSATCGAGLTSGLTRQLTGVNLSSGIRQPVDVYMYGMAWLMAAMFIGRVLPVLVIGRAGVVDARPPNGPIVT